MDDDSTVATGSMVTLEGTWWAALDPENRGRQDHWFDGVRDDARDAAVPDPIQYVFPNYHGVFWYWHRFPSARTPTEHERALIRFGSVHYLADMWLNGTHLGRHEGGEAPFLLDATGSLKVGGENLLAVRVLDPSNEMIDNMTRATVATHDRYGGIMRRVELLVVPDVRIADVYVRPCADTGRIGVTVTVQNDRDAAAKGDLTAEVGPAKHGRDVLSASSTTGDFPPGQSTHEMTLRVENHRLWGIADPYLYRVEAGLVATSPDGASITDDTAVRCGFRDFRVIDGYFRLNGERIFVRSLHTGPWPLDLSKFDPMLLKASGFNMIRFLAGAGLPEQLDLCDELGLLVYEESGASWLMEDSPFVKERFTQMNHDLILRDRSRPSIVVWGMLNETEDGTLFRHAVDTLQLVRDLDGTRLVLLGSGRWDGDWSIGSVSNPDSREWDHVWGEESREGRKIVEPHERGYVDGAGDAHWYPATPQTSAASERIRNFGHQDKPVFLSEYGIGSLVDVVKETRYREQVGENPDDDWFTINRSNLERFAEDWQRFKMDDVYPSYSHLIRRSQELHNRQRLLGFDLIRANPRICGYSLTSLVDCPCAFGEGIMTALRSWKYGVMDALQDGWAPLRWCLFVSPTHNHLGRTTQIEAVLANEDALAPGEYPASFRVFGPNGIAWEKQSVVRIPQPEAGQDGPLAVPVLCEDLALEGPAGEYEFVATLERGGDAAGGRLKFHLSDAGHLPKPDAVTLWGVAPRVADWLRGRGVECRPFDGRAPGGAEVILVGDLAEVGSQLGDWRELASRMAKGAAVVFAAPEAFKRGDDNVGWLPLGNKGRWYQFSDWLYHKECVARDHPIFDGLSERGIMDWDYYDQVIPHYVPEGQDAPDDVAAAYFAPGYMFDRPYAAGLLTGAYTFGAGRFVLNAFRVLEHVDANPAADRLLLNLLSYGAAHASRPLGSVPSDFDARLKEIGYE